MTLCVSVLSLVSRRFSKNKTNCPFWPTKPPEACSVYYCRRRALFRHNTTPTVTSSVATTRLLHPLIISLQPVPLSFSLFPTLLSIIALIITSHGVNCTGKSNPNLRCHGKLTANTPDDAGKSFLPLFPSLLIRHSLSTHFTPISKSSAFTQAAFDFFSSPFHSLVQFTTQKKKHMLGPR